MALSISDSVVPSFSFLIPFLIYNGGAYHHPFILAIYGASVHMVLDSQ